MAHDYSHSRDNDRNLRRVVSALLLTGTFMVVEVIGGILSGSLALLADAGHMLTDTLALGLAAVAFHVGKRPATPSLTYGYQRLQILAAFVNGLSLLLIVGWIVVEAAQRFVTPRDIAGELMLGIATAGLIVNILAFAILHSGDRDNLNIRGATLHVAGDLLGSIAAIVAAVVILYTGWTIVDPLLSLAVAGLILRSAWTLVRRSAHVLLEGAPEWLDVEAMREHISSELDAVREIHHVHVWGITPQDLLLTMHVRLAPGTADPTVVLHQVRRMLERDYGISHSTLEPEFAACDDTTC